MFQVKCATDMIEFDLTGLHVTAKVEHEKQRQEGHGGMNINRDYVTLQLPMSIIGAHKDSPKAVPGSEGAIYLRMGVLQLRNIRDAADAILGLADETDENTKDKE